MAQQYIVTTPVNSGEGTPLATAFDYCDSNFSELYSRAQTVPPGNLVGKLGDEAGFYAYDSTYFYYCFANYDGTSTIWGRVTQAGNITATQLLYGNTSVTIPTPSANVVISVNSTNNVVTFSNTGAFVNGVISASGNVRGGNINTVGNVSATGNIIASYLIGNGSQLTGLPASYSNANVDAYLPVYSGNISASIISATGNITSGNLLTAGLLTATGGLYSGANIVGHSNITGGNIISSGLICATGNVVGSNFSTTGSVTTGVVTAGVISATGNITGNYIIGNGSLLTGIASGGSNYANANVAAYLPTYSGNIGGSLTTNSQPYITSVGNLSGLTVNGLNAVTLNPTANSITVNTTFGGTININSSGLGSIDNMSIGANTAASAKFTTVSASGNVTGAYFIGDGSQLTGITGGSSYANANVAAYLPIYSGNLSSGNLSVTNNAAVSGNLSVSGNIISNVTGTVTGQLNGLVNGVNTAYGTWDFGYVAANTYTNPIQWIFAQTSVGNIDMGTISAPASYAIDIGTIF